MRKDVQGVRQPSGAEPEADRLKVKRHTAAIKANPPTQSTRLSTGAPPGARTRVRSGGVKKKPMMAMSSERPMRRKKT